MVNEWNRMVNMWKHIEINGKRMVYKWKHMANGKKEK